MSRIIFCQYQKIPDIHQNLELNASQVLSVQLGKKWIKYEHSCYQNNKTPMSFIEWAKQEYHLSERYIFGEQEKYIRFAMPYSKRHRWLFDLVTRTTRLSLDTIKGFWSNFPVSTKIVKNGKIYVFYEAYEMSDINQGIAYFKMLHEVDTTESLRKEAGYVCNILKKAKDAILQARANGENDHFCFITEYDLDTN